MIIYKYLFNVFNITSSLRPALNQAATQWTLSDTYIGWSFFSGFDHQTISDPTHGRVKLHPLSVCSLRPLIRVYCKSRYVDQGTAQNLNLSYATSDTFILRADYKTTLGWGTTGPGRKSVRIQSKKTWGASVVVLNLRHMPRGCGCVTQFLFGSTR